MIGGSMAYSARGVEAPTPVVATDAASDISVTWAAFAGPLRAFVARRVPAGLEPDDVVQEVFLRVVRHLPALRDGDRIEAWLYQIARNTLRDAMRVRQRRDSRTDALEIDVPTEAEVEDVHAAEAELAPCLTPMIARLAEPYRTAIELTSQQGLTQTDAAKRVGVSVSGMKSRVQRARAQLKQILLRCCEIDVDRRGGVSAYQLREPAACENSIDKTEPEGRCAPGGCSPGRQAFAASDPGWRRLR
jgi:RNA polymerase sigma-70 factor (ECF subfamily)